MPRPQARRWPKSLADSWRASFWRAKEGRAFPLGPPQSGESPLSARNSALNSRERYLLPSSQSIVTMV